MKIQSIDRSQRLTNSGLLQLNLFQLSFLSTLFLNLTITLFGTTVRASETILKDSPQQPPIAERIPTEAIASPILENPSSVVLFMLAAAPVAIKNTNNQDQSIPKIAPVSSPTPAPEVAPITQTISQQASDLSGSASESKPVNNPLIPPLGWRFDFEPYLFLPLDVQGDIFLGKGRNLLFPNRPEVILGNRGINLNVNASLSDVTARLTNIFGASGRFQAWNGNFGIVSEQFCVAACLSIQSD